MPTTKKKDILIPGLILGFLIPAVLVSAVIFYGISKMDQNKSEKETVEEKSRSRF